MFRLAFYRRLVLLSILLVPTGAFAYFPPVTGATNETPPNPFPVQNLGGLGEPEVTEPDKVPTVATPEPTTMVTALMGLVVAAGVGYRQRHRQAAN